MKTAMLSCYMLYLDHSAVKNISMNNIKTEKVIKLTCSNRNVGSPELSKP